MGNKTQPVYQFMTEAGDGTGEHNFNGDQTPSYPRFDAAGTLATIVHELHITIVHLGGLGAADKYGDLAILSNGMLIQTIEGTTFTSLNSDVLIKTSGDWGLFGCDVTYTAGTTFSYVQVCWKFPGGLRLDPELSQGLRVVMSDDFSTLIQHTFFIKGHTE